MSFIESCLALALILSMTVVAVPALHRTHDDYVLNAMAYDVATRLHGARIRAISRNFDCRLRVTSTISYVMECQSPVWITAETVDLPVGYSIAANARPEFHHLGNAAPAGTITLRNAAGRAKSIIVNTAGRIRIQ
jgi:Tfp pilus assembly protein FimT